MNGVDHRKGGTVGNVASGSMPAIDRTMSWIGRSHWENDIST